MGAIYMTSTWNGILCSQSCGGMVGIKYMLSPVSGWTPLKFNPSYIFREYLPNNLFFHD